ncbi:MAG TPA: serine protease [Lacipirellulaceae bacterium]|jgi:hypothetical protein|nr:serine protease [Lacipirellulaceae bacterium]
MAFALRRILFAVYFAAALSASARASLFSSVFGAGHTPIYDSLPGDVTPHPSVARIIVPEDGATAFGSGTLVGVHENRGLVVTNWHVVRDAVGLVDVVFPDGFHSHAKPLKVDQDWDLAALVIWKPNCEPVKIATNPPQPGDLLTIHGYGRGKYRIATGRCTSYYSPQPNFPHEMVELDVEARQGDSGGPIFNQQGEIAGVLFGAGQGTTMGSFAPRVRVFLASVAPDFEQSTSQLQVATADQPPPTIVTDSGALNIASTGGPLDSYPSSPWSPPRAKDSAHGVDRPAIDGAHLVSNTVPKQTEQRQALTLSDFSRAAWYDPLKTALAAVGLAAVALRLVKFIR